MATSAKSATSAAEAAVAACGVPISDVPTVSAAAEAMAVTASAEAAKEQTLLRYEQILDPHRRAGDGPTISLDEVLEARASVVAARIEHAQAVLEARRARQAYEDAVTDEKARRLALIRAAKRDVARRLAAKLDALRRGENEEAAVLDEAERSLRGGALVNQLAWPELMNDARFDAWRAALISDGVLDAKVQ